MNWRKTFVYLFAVLLLLGLLPVLSFAQGGAGQTAAAARIEADLLEQLAAGGTSDMIVVMAEQADLSPAYSMGWKERGEFVYNTLKATAERSQAHAKALLEANGLKYQTFIAGNELYVWAGNLQVASALAALPEVAFIYATRTYYIDPVVSSEPAEPAPQALDWGIVDTGADDFWTQFGMQGDGIVVANIDTGVQWNHPALDQAYRCPGNPTDPACWYDPSNVCGGTVCDNNGHGTHTMGHHGRRRRPLPDLSGRHGPQRPVDRLQGLRDQLLLQLRPERLRRLDRGPQRQPGQPPAYRQQLLGRRRLQHLVSGQGAGLAGGGHLPRLFRRQQLQL